MSAHEVVIIGAIFLGPVLSSVGLWLRLYFQLCGERERRRYLHTAATVLPAGSRIREQRGDGTVMTLSVGGTGQNEGQR